MNVWISLCCIVLQRLIPYYILSNGMQQTHCYPPWYSDKSKSIDISETNKQLEICRVTPIRNKSRVLLFSHPVGSLQWRHNGRDGISNHQPHHYSLNLLFRCRSKKTSKISVTGLCAGKSPETSESPAQIASNAKNVSIWWRHHGNLFWQL